MCINAAVFHRCICGILVCEGHIWLQAPPLWYKLHTLLLDRAELTSITPPDATPDETPEFIGHTHTHTRSKTVSKASLIFRTQNKSRLFPFSSCAAPACSSGSAARLKV